MSTWNCKYCKDTGWSKLEAVNPVPGYSSEAYSIDSPCTMCRKHDDGQAARIAEREADRAQRIKDRENSY